MKLLFAVAALAAGAASAPPQRFNLVCAGTQTTHSRLSDSEQPYSFTYRVDLAVRQWCDGTCEATQKIAEVTPTRLRLERQQNDDTPSERDSLASSIDRRTGQHVIIAEHADGTLGLVRMDWSGTCDKRPFTGFPKVQTKF